MLGYCFTKGLTQIFNLCTHLKLEYNIKYLNYIQQNFSFRIPILWNYVFFFFDMISGLISIHPSIIKYIIYKVDLKNRNMTKNPILFEIFCSSLPV